MYNESHISCSVASVNAQRAVIHKALLFDEGGGIILII